MILFSRLGQGRRQGSHTDHKERNGLQRWINRPLVLILFLLFVIIVVIFWNHLDRSETWSENQGWTWNPSPVLQPGVIIGQPWQNRRRPLSFIAPMVATYLNRYSSGYLGLKVLEGI